MLKRFPVPWIAAHMGGNPEDSIFCPVCRETPEPLPRYQPPPNGWCELGKHPREELLAFFEKRQDRIFFGSDIVTMNDQLAKKTPEQQHEPDERSLGLA